MRATGGPRGYMHRVVKRLISRTVGPAFRSALEPELHRIHVELRRLRRVVRDQTPTSATPGGSGEAAALAQVTDRALAEEIASRLHGEDGRTETRLADILRWLPDEDLIRFYAEYDLAGTMDYKRHEIKLRRTSNSIRHRLGASSKEPLTVEWIEQNIKPGDVFYDIGANVGSFSLIAAKLTANQARIFAFEPSFATFADLCRNVMLNECQNSITPLPLALTSENTLCAFEFRSLESGASRHRMKELTGRFRATERQTMLAYRLDDLVHAFELPAPNLIKLDVDGPELAVLRGAEAVLRDPGCRSLIVELNDDADAIRQFMVSVGFQLEAEHGRGRSTPYWVFKKDQIGETRADAATS